MLGYSIQEFDIRQGFDQVCTLTGLMGRWQKMIQNPTLICDTGHNTGGIKYIVEQLSNLSYNRLHMVIGMVNDKDIRGVLSMLPKYATYYFTKASVSRALNEKDLQQLAQEFGLNGTIHTDVKSATISALRYADKNDLIFVGGSSFIVADFLTDSNIILKSNP